VHLNDALRYSEPQAGAPLLARDERQTIAGLPDEVSSAADSKRACC
jgi:hypothetical protein